MESGVWWSNSPERVGQRAWEHQPIGPCVAYTINFFLK